MTLYKLEVFNITSGEQRVNGQKVVDFAFNSPTGDSL